MRIFVPVEDPGSAADGAPLVPYRCGLPFALDVDARAAGFDQRWIVSTSPGDTPSARALPPLSSST